MAAVASTPRSRGSVCGLALVLLGAWGGIAPYAGPTFGYGYTPGGAWTLNEGRLVLSALPGAVALIAGLVIMLTRSRGAGALFALLAALAGAWFVVGEQSLRLLPASLSAATITAGSPIGTSVRHIELTQIGFFWGVGTLIVFFAALALGRFSLAALKDQQELGTFVTNAAASPSGYQPLQGDQPFTTTQPQYAADPFSSYSPVEYPAQYPPEQGFQSEPQMPEYPSQYPAENAPPAGTEIDSAQTQTQFPPGS